jgi:hypothetical protein
MALVLTPSAATSQEIAARRLAPREVPPGVAFSGRIEAARQWRDRLGDNLILLTRGPQTTTVDRDEEVKGRVLHAYHYVRAGAGYRLLWQTVDSDDECPWDLTVAFVPGSLTVTDADRDGTAETSFLYRLACRGGVDPAGLKLILHEGATKYAIRGSTDMRALGPEYPAPEMRMDPALQRIPALRALAERQWRRFVPEPAEPDEGAP